MKTEETLLVPVFKTHSSHNAAKSAKAGRPIYDDIEVCEIRQAGNKSTVGVFPAHEVWRWQDTQEGGREPITYAMRYPDQYKRFKAGAAQAKSGTPLEEAPFLTQGKRLELKALNIHTVESLAALDGQPLKNLGQDGRALKNQATAFLETASSSADATRYADENAKLKERIAELERERKQAQQKKTSAFDDMSDDDIKEWIAERTGSKPRGNPNRDTLVSMAEDLEKESA
jgi:hypothetical protein